MLEHTRYVGMDVHLDTIVVAVADAMGTPPQVVQVLPNHLPRVRKFFETMRRDGGPIRACYEASGCGYVLQRAMTSWEIPCEVIAPSLIPKKPGDRRKTDKRDAEKLAGLYRSGQLTPVHVPTEAEERVRSVTRARQAVRGEIHVSKQQVLKHLQRIGHVFHEGKAWTRDFRAWLAALELDPLDRKVIGFHLLLLEQKEAVLKELDATIEEIAKQESYCAVVGRLRCLRGIDTLTALCLVAEIGDARRFASPRRLMGYLGLSITEDSSGETERRGGITKAGNGRCRRLLIEAAWHARTPPRVSARLKQRRADQPPEVVAHAVRADHRLHKRYKHLLERMRPVKVVTAIARELVGFIWAQMLGTRDALMVPNR